MKVSGGGGGDRGGGGGGGDGGCGVYVYVYVLLLLKHSTQENHRWQCLPAGVSNLQDTHHSIPSTETNCLKQRPEPGAAHRLPIPPSGWRSRQ